jgi:hypothetical protein
MIAMLGAACKIDAQSIKVESTLMTADLCKLIITKTEQ